jgi:DNA modification methylase
MFEIHCESNLDTMARMADGSIDLTVTSPPYDDLRVYNGYSFEIERVVPELYRVTKEGGVVVWVVGDRTKDGDESGTSFRQALFFKEAGFKLWDTMLFVKQNPAPSDCGRRYRQCFEYMFAFSKGLVATFNPLTEPTKTAGRIQDNFRLENTGRRPYVSSRPMVVADTRKLGNIFTYAIGTSQSFKHPAVFPEALARDQILTWSNPGELVYDPFLGSGTTAKVAIDLGRRVIGSEISEEYAEMSRLRCRDHAVPPLF